MLVLTRLRGETIVVDGPCVITLTDILRYSVRIGIEAAKEVGIRRGEVPKESFDQMHAERYGQKENGE